MDFQAPSLYRSAMWEENRVYPEIETGYAFKPNKNDVFVRDFKKQSFNQNGNYSAILKTNFYNPPNLIFQHLPVKK